MTPDPIFVPVQGGDLAVATWGAGVDSGVPVVVGIHGITANFMTWALVADALGDEVALLTPDLRGRARSASLRGPYGMAAHADDIAAALDHLGVERATVAGHSMGAFVAATFAVRHPDRLAGLVLVDGGVSIATVPESDIDTTLNRILGPTMQRLSMTFATREAWLDFWKAHPALAQWSPAVEAYVMADLVGVEPELRSSVSIEAVRADGADTLQGPGGSAFRCLTRPTPWLRAPRGLLNQVPPLYPDDVAAALCAEVPALVDHLVEDVNHFTILLSERGASVVAEAIRDQVEASSRE